MRKSIAFLLIFTLVLTMFSSLFVAPTMIDAAEPDENMKEIHTFDSIVTNNNGSFPVGSSGCSYDATSGILSFPTSNKTLFVTDKVEAAYYTIHVEIAPTNLNSGNVIQNAVLLGNTTSHYRFYIKDTVRTATANRPAYARLSQNVSGSDTIIVEDQSCDKMQFNVEEWFDVDITVDTINSKVYLFVNGNQEIVKTLTNADFSGQIGFYGKNVKFRNLSVSVKSEIYSFESLAPSGTLNITGASNASYADGTLTMTSASNASIFLTDANVANLKKFTLHTEMKIPTYSLSTVFEGGFGVGSSSLYRFFLKDDGRERNVEKLRTAYLAQHITSASGVTALDFNLIPETWIKLDVLVDATKDTENVDIYINNRYVTTYSFAASLMAGAKVGFRGFNGVAFRDFQVLDGLVCPLAVGFTSAQVVLNEKIDVIFTARVPSDVMNLSAEILFDGDIISVTASDLDVNTDTDGYKTVSFTLKDICPQDICKLITVKLYSNGVVIAQKDNYSIQTYCLHLLPNKTHAGTNEELVALRKMLLAILNYGTYAQAFFTEDTVFANAGIAQTDFVHADLSSASSVRNVSAKQNDDYYWQSATLALYNTVCMRFKFVATDIQKVTIKAVVNGVPVQEYAAENFVVLNENTGLYYVDFSKMLANQFDDAITMELWVDGSNLQTVTYSVNSYIHAYYASGKTESDPSYNLIQAIYDYGCIAQAYGG